MKNKNEILSILKNPNLQESGGAHNQKGIDFQRYWAIHRIIELEKSGVDDFLILIEAFQDIAELDDSSNPTKICLYQVKKKDRKEWTWHEITNIKDPKSKKTTKNSIFKESLIGKLFTTIIAFNNLKATGAFISNSGCDLKLIGNTNAATSLKSSLDHLTDEYKQLIKNEMSKMSSDSIADATLPNIFIQKVSISVDDPRTSLIGHAHLFLEERSPRHAGQARSFIDALMAIISPLGGKTDTCNTFDELCKNHGYNRTQFRKALGDLEQIPDMLMHLETWLSQLTNEGMGFMEVTSIRAESASIYRRQVMDNSEDDDKLISDCDDFLNLNIISDKLKPIFDLAYTQLSIKNPNYNKNQILAHFALRAIKKCVDQI